LRCNRSALENNTLFDATVAVLQAPRSDRRFILPFYVETEMP
jgi:hypothetical protein